MTPETAPLWILAWITFALYALGTVRALRAWLRRRGALVGVTAVFALGLLRQAALLFQGAGGPLGLDARTGAELASLGIAIAAFAALRALRRTTRERDRVENLHWDSMETVRMMTELASGPDSDFRSRLATLLALGAERFGLEHGVAWSSEEGGRALAVHPPTAGDAQATLPADLLARAAAATRPLALSDASRPGHTFFAAPLRFDGRVHGSLAFWGSGRSALRFTATDKDLLNLMAQWIASELERGQREAAADVATAPRVPLRRATRRATRGDLNEAIRSSEARLRRSLGEASRLELRLETTLPSVRPGRVALPTLVESLAHAASALGPGRLTIETGCLAARGAAGRAPHFVTLEVRLEGEAVDEASLERVLDAGDEGGEPDSIVPLARLERLLRRGGGDLSVGLEPKRRVALTAFLPAAPQAAAPSARPPAAGAAASAGAQSSR